jgi:PTS system galactitol-specific IIA component
MNYPIFAVTNKEFNCWKECYTYLADKLKEENRVKEGFLDSVLAREEQFPTGLETLANIGVAIPHPFDGGFTVTPSIGVAVIPKPISVNSMVDASEQVMVSVVFLLALTKSDAHLEVLGHLMEILQDEKSLREIADAKDTRFIEEKIGSMNL